MQARPEELVPQVKHSILTYLKCCATFEQNGFPGKDLEFIKHLLNHMQSLHVSVLN